MSTCLDETVLLVDSGRHFCPEVVQISDQIEITAAVPHSLLSGECFAHFDRAWHDLPVPRYPNFSASMRFRVEQDMVMLQRKGLCRDWSRRNLMIKTVEFLDEKIVKSPTS